MPTLRDMVKAELVEILTARHGPSDSSGRFAEEILEELAKKLAREAYDDYFVNKGD